MIPIYRIDAEGYYIVGNDAIMYPGDTPPDGYVTEQPPSGFLNPRYVEGTWIDQVPPPPLPTDAERIAALEETVASLADRIAALENLTP